MIRTACASSSKVAFFIVICQKAVHNGTKEERANHYQIRLRVGCSMPFVHPELLLET